MEKEQNIFQEILDEQVIPVIAINQEGIVFFVNDGFEEEYGWSKDDLKGNPVTKILPPHMRDAHNLGFSHFLTTETSRIMDKEISLPVYCKDGTVEDALHFITAKKQGGEWNFAALIKPALKYEHNRNDR